MVRFGIVGVVNTLLGLLVIFGVKWFFGLGDMIANLLGYTVGILVGFALNSRWSFRYGGPIRPALYRFILVLFVAYLANLSVVLVFIYGFGLNSYLSQAAGIIPYAVVLYLGSYLFAFKESNAHSRFGVDAR